MDGMIKFCVGSPEGPRSTVWKVWARKSDVYLQSRMMGGEAKISLHGSGRAQFSRTNEWARRSGARNSQRHIVRWFLPPPPEGEPSHVFRIVVPRREMQIAGIPRRPLQVNWIRSPAPNKVVAIECYLSARDEYRHLLPYQFLNSLPHDSGRLILLTHEDVLTPENESALENARSEIRNLVALAGTDPGPAPRGMAFFVAHDGVRGVIEVNPSLSAA